MERIGYGIGALLGLLVLIWNRKVARWLWEVLGAMNAPRPEERPEWRETYGPVWPLHRALVVLWAAAVFVAGVLLLLGVVQT